MSTNYHVFIGFDDREKEAYQVAKYSIEKYSKDLDPEINLVIHKLEHKPLRSSGLFTRPFTVEGTTGQYIDGIDGKPFSTQFTFTRFLVPELWKNLSDPNKSPLVMFVDCDFLWLDNLKKMFKQIEQDKMKNQGKAPVYCTQHDYKPKSSIKMDNINQTAYNMKLWAAMMVFDMDNPENLKLTPELVNTAKGRDLMNFCWLSNHHDIAHIDESWHFIPNHSEKNPMDGMVKVIHYTTGGPNLTNCRDNKYVSVWDKHYQEYLASKLLKVEFNIEDILNGE